MGFHDVEYYAIPPHWWSQFSVVLPSWWRVYGSSSFFMCIILSSFQYYSGSTLRASPCDLLFRIAVSECCNLALMAFLLSALIGAPLGLRKKIPGLVHLLSVSVFSDSSPCMRIC